MKCKDKSFHAQMIWMFLDVENNAKKRKKKTKDSWLQKQQYCWTLKIHSNDSCELYNNSH